LGCCGHACIDDRSIISLSLSLSLSLPLSLSPASLPLFLSPSSFFASGSLVIGSADVGQDEDKKRREMQHAVSLTHLKHDAQHAGRKIRHMTSSQPEQDVGRNPLGITQCRRSPAQRRTGLSAHLHKSWGIPPSLSVIPHHPESESFSHLACVC